MKFMIWIGVVIVLIGCAPRVQKPEGPPEIVPAPHEVMEYAALPYPLAMGPAGLEQILDTMALRGWQVREFLPVVTRESVVIIWEKVRETLPEVQDTPPAVPQQERPNDHAVPQEWQAER